MNDSDFLQMEEPKAILKYFRSLSKNENEDIILDDRELSFCRKNKWSRSFENDLQKSRVSFPYVLFPLQEEEISSDSEWDVARREAGSHVNMTEEERNIINLMKQQQEAVNPARGPGNGATNQQLNKLPEERCDKVNGQSKEDGRILPDERASNGSPYIEGTVCVCVGQVRAESKKEGDIIKVESEFDPSFQLKDGGSGRSAISEREGNKMPLTATTEEQEPGQTDEATFFKNVEQAKMDEEEEDGEEKRDIFPCSSAQTLQPFKLKEASHRFSITPAAFANNPQHGPTFSRSTFSPNSPTEKPIHLPALFSGLRVLRKGVVGPEHDTLALIGSPSQRTKGETLFDLPAQNGFLEQISTFLSRDKRSDEKEVTVVERSLGEKGEDGARKGGETESGRSETTKPVVSSAEAAFDAFKAFFTPKPLKKDPTEKVDLESLRKKIKADRDALRALFDRTSTKIPETEESADCQVGHDVDVFGINDKVYTVIFSYTTRETIFQK